MTGSRDGRYLRPIVHLALALATVMLLMEVPPSAAQSAQVRVQNSSAGHSQAGSASQTRPPASSPPSTGGPTHVPRAPTTSPPPSSGSPGGGHWGGGYWGHGGRHWGWGWWGGLYWPYYHWGLWGWGPHYPYRGGYPVAVYGQGAPALGGLKLKVKPKKASVYVAGDYIGQAKRFDGYPGYLWLEQGSHDLTFYLPGYSTQTQAIRVLPGVVARVEIQLEPGESVPPEEVSAGAPVVPEPQVRTPPAGPPDRPAGTQPGSTRLVIDPPDASVYLDGRFLGTARELAGLHAGLIMEPGRHSLEVVRPGYASETRDFVVPERGELELTVSLKPE